MIPLLFPINDLIESAISSSLNDSFSEGSSTIDVYSISDFEANKILIIGELGDEGTELIKTHPSTDPSGNTITLATTLAKSHSKDTKVYIVDYDQIEFSHAATETGSKTVRSTQTINPEMKNNRYNDATDSTGYIFTRYKNSIDSTFSDYSDAYLITGLAANTVGYAIEEAMEDHEYTSKLTHERLIRITNSALRYIRGKLKKWSTYQEFDYIVDQTERGKHIYSMPTTAYDRNSNKSILSVRIGEDNYLKYMDKRELVTALEDSIHTTVATEPVIGQSTLVLANGYDLPESGTVNVYYNNTQYEITYTGITRATGILTGVPSSGDGSITVNFPVDTNVWYGENEGEPTHYTVYDGNLAMYPMPDSTYQNKNIFMDFYTDIVEVDSDADTLSIERYDMIVNYLRWEVRNILERDGKKDFTDGDWMMFKDKLADAIKKETSGQKYKMRPKINRISDSRGKNLPFDRR